MWISSLLGVQVRQPSTPERRGFPLPGFEPYLWGSGIPWQDHEALPSLPDGGIIYILRETPQQYCLALSPSHPRQNSPTSGHFLVTVIRHEDCSVGRHQQSGQGNQAMPNRSQFPLLGQVKTGPSLWASSAPRVSWSAGIWTTLRVWKQTLTSPLGMAWSLTWGASPGKTNGNLLVIHV